MASQLTEKQVRDIVRQELSQANAAARFQINPIQRHIHNNLDSPYVFQPTMTYIGYVGYDGSTILLPKDWTVEKISTGFFTVTHNLNTLQYAVTASPAQSTNETGEPVIETFDTTVDINWFNYSNGAVSPIAFDTSFYFILVVSNNRSTQQPIYGGNITL